MFSDADHQGRAGAAIAYLDDAALVLASVKERLLAMLDLGPGARVLDVGCGAGHDLIALAEIGVASVGIDISAHMLRTSNERVAGSTPRPLLARADGAHLPFRVASFDACRIERVLQHVPDPRAVLAQVSTALRPGGQIVVFEPQWASLTTESDDPANAAEVMAAITARVAHPTIGSELGPLLAETGYDAVECVPDPVVLPTFDRFCRLIAVEPILERTVRAGRLSAENAGRWLAEMRARSQRNEFRGTLDRTIARATTGT